MGGPGGTLVAKGSGHDLLVDSSGDATVQVGSPGDKVVVSGPDDRVACSGDSVHDIIEYGKSDSVGARCRADRDRVMAVTDPARQVAGAADSQPVTGNGTNADPFIAACNGGIMPRVVGYTCTVSSFPPRTLSGLWANEYVPAYKCPSDYSLNSTVHEAPNGTELPDGVGIHGLGPVEVSISGVNIEKIPIPGETGSYYSRRVGTLTGLGNSSATNWTTGTVSYQVILYCVLRANGTG